MKWYRREQDGIRSLPRFRLEWTGLSLWFSYPRSYDRQKCGRLEDRRRIWDGQPVPRRIEPCVPPHGGDQYGLQSQMNCSEVIHLSLCHTMQLVSTLIKETPLKRDLTWSVLTCPCAMALAELSEYNMSRWVVLSCVERIIKLYMYAGGKPSSLSSREVIPECTLNLSALLIMISTSFQYLIFSRALWGSARI